MGKFIAGVLGLIMVVGFYGGMLGLVLMGLNYLIG